LYALLSGAVTSGLGYAIWYTVVPRLTRTRAATVQLSVPVLAALAGALFVQEPITMGLLLTATAVLGGIALVVLNKRA
jgi:drug/metabolite transporter (DMT)-like permease